MTETSNSDQLRAATSLRRAAELIGYCCALHRGHPEEAIHPDLTMAGLPPDCAVDVARALGTVLGWQLGDEEAIRRIAGLDDVTDLVAVAELVAEVCGWDGWIGVRAHRLAAQLHDDFCQLGAIPETPEPTPGTER